MPPVLLVSMPWDQLEHPPIQLGILQTTLERDGIGADVCCLGLDFLDHCMAGVLIIRPWGLLGRPLK